MAKQRNSNIELLRILCMFLIIIHHFMAHGNLWMLLVSVNRVIVDMVMPFGKIAFDCFVAISCWFLVKSRFTSARFLKIWLQVLFYNVVFTLLAYFMQGDTATIDMHTLLGSFFPMIGNSHGFASAYLAFYLLLPILTKVQQGLNKKQTLYVLYVLGTTQVLLPLLSTFTEYTQPLQSEFLLFVFVYFLCYYLQIWPIKFLQPMAVKLTLLATLLVFIVGNNILTLFRNDRIFSRIQLINSTEFSVFNIFSGLLLCMVFQQIKLPHSSTINTIASTTFGILLFHDHNFFRNVVWQDFKSAFVYETLNPLVFITIVAVISACIFIIGAAIDLIKQYCFERWILKLPFIRRFVQFLDRIFGTETQTVEGHIQK